MPTPEHRAGGPGPEQERPPYHQAARFAGEGPAGRAYRQAQRLIYETACDLSTYRLQINRVWHVAVLGDEPPEDLRQQLGAILAAGSPATLPADVVGMLLARRAEASALAPWVQRHYRPGKRL